MGKNTKSRPRSKKRMKEQQILMENVKRRRLQTESQVVPSTSSSCIEVVDSEELIEEESPHLKISNDTTAASEHSEKEYFELQNVIHEDPFDGLVNDLRNASRSSIQDSHVNEKPYSSQSENHVTKNDPTMQYLDTDWILNSMATALSNTGDTQDIELNTEVTSKVQASEMDTQIFDSDYPDLQVEVEESSSKNIVIGRRIIGVTSFFEKLKMISAHGPLSCGLQCMEIVGEKLNGLQSRLKLLCKMCNNTFFVDSDTAEEQYPKINDCAVAATISIGCGHSQLQEFSAALNLPIMSLKIYQSIHDALSTEWTALAQETMNNAAEKERAIAIAKGRVNENGIPIIDVIADGCYGKRTYKKNYSSLSGAGAILGRETGEILYLAVRNKYCYSCDRAETRKEVAKEHICYKNYSGPSTGMESDILLEGFKISVESHNLIYGRLISDGDASTYCKIQNARPYRNENVNVEKIECRNHLLRNFVNKLTALKTETRYNIKDRKLLTQTKILTMRRVITSAIQKNKNPECSDVHILYSDINLAHLHAFGDHSKCKHYFCDKVGKQDDTPNSFYHCPLWLRITIYVQHMAGHANSLIHDVDSNLVERYHSVVAKYIGGKRVNFSLKQSYGTRCNAAAVSFNTAKPISRLYKKIMNQSPRGKIKMLEDRRIKMKVLSKKYLRRKRRLRFPKKDANYGENSLQEDMSPEMLELSKKNFLNTLQKTDEDRHQIQLNTSLQRNSGTWMELRRTLLTASNFARVIKRRPDTPSAPIVKQILQQKALDQVASINHGIVNEKTALSQLALQENVEIRPCGLFLDDKYPFLGATPDGLIGSDTIVEVKCPITAARVGIAEAIRTKKVNFWLNKGGVEEININHSWFIQIQGQLHVTRRDKCLFGAWSGENQPVKTATILRNDQFWSEKMEGKLIKFYMDCLLPEIIDPRLSRNMPIREPDYIAELIEKKKQKTTAGSSPSLPSTEQI